MNLRKRSVLLELSIKYKLNSILNIGCEHWVCLLATQRPSSIPSSSAEFEIQKNRQNSYNPGRLGCDIVYMSRPIRHPGNLVKELLLRVRDSSGPPHTSEMWAVLSALKLKPPPYFSPLKDLPSVWGLFWPRARAVLSPYPSVACSPFPG